MYKKILFTTTASPICDNAAKVAFDLAEKYKSDLYMLYVFGVPTHGFRASVLDRRSGEEETYSEDYVDWVKEEMKTTYDLQLQRYPKTAISAVAGIPHMEILRTARKEQADLIIMGAHTRIDDTGALRYRNIVGSTMQQVACSAKAPVMIVSRPCSSCETYFRHIVFATNFTSKCRYAFEYACDTAKSSGSHLTLFHAISLEDSFSMNQEDIEGRIREAADKIDSLYLRKTDFTGNISVIVREGDPHTEILKYAREQEGDLIVMSHQTKKTHLHTDVIANTVEQVVLRSACPVVSVNHPFKIDTIPPEIA